MGEQRQFFRFRLPWLRPASVAPRPVIEPRPQPAAPTQAPSQTTVTIPIQRPPFRPAGIAPVPNTPTQVQAPAPPQKTEPLPVPARGTLQTQTPSLAATPAREASTSPSSTRIARQPEQMVQAVSRQKSPSRLVSQPMGQTSSQPPSPSRRPAQVQTISPPKRPAMVTQVASQQPDSEQQSSSLLVSLPTGATSAQPPSPPRRATQVRTVSPVKRPAMATQVASQPVVSKQQSPSRSVSQPTGEPSSPPRRATQVQTISPTKRSAMATQVASQPPSSTQPLSSASKEPSFRPFGVSVKPWNESTRLKDAAPNTEAAKETPTTRVKPKEMEERKKVADEPSVTSKLLAVANDAGTKTRELLEQVKTKTMELLEKDDIERKKRLTTSSTDEKQIKTVNSSSTYPKDRRSRSSNSHEKRADSKSEQAPLHKEIREDISKFVHKLVTGKPVFSTDEEVVSVVTLAGENSGASFQSGSESTKTDGYKIMADESVDTSAGYGEGNSGGNSMIEQNVAPKAYVNSNTQSINNSIVFESCLEGRNPGVHLDFFHDAKAEPLETSQLKHSSMAEKSKVLIIGGTGYIGKFIVEASAKEGHPTFALVREGSVSDPVKGKVIENFKNLGVQLLYGDLYDHESLVKAIKQADVVISAAGHRQLADQVKIIAAIKEAGNVKRFFPSEFGNDVDRVHAVEPAKTAFANKAQIRRAIEAEGIPYTYVSSNCFAGYFLTNLAQPGATAPPRDKVVIPGDGNPKAVFNHEGDIGTYTIKAVDDPRTLNKVLYIKPPKNSYSFNEIVALWEKLIGKTLEKTYVPEDQLLKQIQDAPIPINVALAIRHSIFVNGDQTNFEIEPTFGVEASELYPDVKYTTVEEYLRRFV